MKQFIAVLSLFSLLAMPVVSFAKPLFTPPGKLKVKINDNSEVTPTSTSTSTPPNNSTSTPPNNSTSTPPGNATSTLKAPKVNFNLTGEIVGVNASSSLLEVKVKTINHFSTRREFRGKTVMIKVDANTVIKMSGKKKAAVLADLGAGQRVTIKGKLENNMFTANSIVAAGKPGKAKGISNILNLFKKK